MTLGYSLVRGSHRVNRVVSKPAHQTLVVPPQCGAVTNSGIAKSALQKGIYLGDEAIGCGGGGKRHRIKSYGRGSFCSENRRGSTINRKSAAFFLGLFKIGRAHV